MYQRALSEYEKVWGLDHISTLSAVNYLASLFSSGEEKGKGKVDIEERLSPACNLIRLGLS